MSNPCNFCDRKFKTHQGLSSHYKIHKNLPVSDWVERGPRRSKIKTAHFKAEKEAGRQISDDGDPVLSPEPLRAVKWVGPDSYVELPWLTQNPESEPSPIRPPGPPSHFRDSDWVTGPGWESESEDSDSEVGNSQKRPLFDLNLPALD